MSQSNPPSNAQSNPSSDSPRMRLPMRPSEVYLKKQAKRRAKANPSMQLAETQHQIAVEYGCRNWAELMHVVETMNRGAGQLVSVKNEFEALPKAANTSNIQTVREILASGQFTHHDLDLALARAVLRFSDRSEIAKLLIEAGADPDGQYGSNYGPIVFVTGECLDPDGLQFLIDAGADVTFAPVETKYGRQCPLSYFLGSYVRGHNDAKHRGIDILLRSSAFVPPEVTPAMMAIHRGDATALGEFLDADPSLLKRRFADMPYGNLSLRGATLLHAAAEFDELDCCGALLKRGADVNAAADVIDRAGGQTPVFHSVNNARLAATLKLSDAGAQLDVADHSRNTPLWHLCGSWASAVDRVAVAKLVIERGAAVRRACENQSTALHQAARHGPEEMVELLLRSGAKEWQADKAGKLPIDCARDGAAADKAAIIELLDRPVIRDPVFKSAVTAIHAGDLDALKLILRDHPNLVHERAMEPDCYPPSYFSNPKLLWFVANNPNLTPTMPANIVSIAKAIIDAGAAKEDLDITMELVMTSSPAVRQRLQLPLMKLLLDHSASAGDLMPVLAHCELEPVKFLLEQGVPLTAPIAAALGRTADLATLLPRSDAPTIQSAFAVAVINRQVAGAQLCLEAGADLTAYLPVHAHSLPVHQAAVNDDVAMLTLLVKHGTPLQIRDKLWNATPLQWAIQTGKTAAENYLRSVGAT